jgi:hypothetical protein
VQQRLLAQLNNSLKRHASVIEQMYAKEPFEAAKLDARINRDAIELLALSEKLGGTPQQSGTSDAQIEARAARLGEVSDREAQQAYLRMTSDEPGSDDYRIVMARFALTRRKQLETELEAIATATGRTVEEVRAVFDATGKVLEPEKLKELAAPAAQPPADPEPRVPIPIAEERPLSIPEHIPQAAVEDYRQRERKRQARERPDDTDDSLEPDWELLAGGAIRRRSSW